VKFTALIFAAAVSSAAAAQDAAEPSYLGVDMGADEDGGRNVYLDLDLTLPGDARLLLAAGESRTSGDSTDITTRSYLIGFGSDPLAPLSAGVEFEHWGDEGDFVSDTWRLNLGLNGERWSLNVRLQERTHTLYTDPDPTCLLCPPVRSHYEIDSSGAGIDAAYYSDGPWSFNASYMEHDYDRDVSNFSRHPRFFSLFFAPTTLDLANGFQDHQYSFGVSYARAWGALSVDWLESVSAVDDAVTHVHTLSFSKPFAERWRLRLHAGRQVDEDTGDSLVFGGLGLTYSW
jgi:hypothetical protein